MRRYDLLLLCECNYVLHNEYSVVQSKELKTEAQSQVIMLENLERNMETTEEELRRQTKNIRSAKEMNENICWMYVVILCEALLLCFLVWIGLVG